MKGGRMWQVQYVMQQTGTCLLTEESGSLALTQLYNLLSPLLFILYAHLLNGSHKCFLCPLLPLFLHHLILLSVPSPPLSAH